MFLSRNTIKDAIILMILAIGVMLFVTHDTTSRSTLVFAGISEERFTDIDIPEIQALWEGKMEHVNGEELYNDFIEEYQDIQPDTQHLLTHIIGGILYDNLGLEGIIICRFDFGYGCFHELFGQAMQQAGFSVLTILNDYCLDLSGRRIEQCQHGIGHGMLAYIGGYEYSSLVEALEICKKYTSLSPYGCTGGVFMEYNFRDIGEETNNRLIKEGEIQVPCSLLSQEFLSSCYFWQVQWLLQSLPGSIEERVGTINTVCKEVQNKKAQEWCF